MFRQEFKNVWRMMAIVLAVAMVCSGMPVSALAAEGEDEAYIEVYTVEDLYNIRNDLTANYILMNDIDLTEATAKGGLWDFEGRGWNPIGSKNIYSGDAFSGHFDGNGHTIRGMRIEIDKSPESYHSYVGLFSYVTGSVTDLAMEEVNIEVCRFRGVCYIGAVSGELSGGSVIGTSVEGKINVETPDNEYRTMYLGGLIAESDGVVSRCCADVDIIVTGKNSVYVGGIAGITLSGQEGMIEKTYVEGSIKVQADSWCVGGVVGEARSPIKNCYNLSTVDVKPVGAANPSNHYAGGICGIGGPSVSYNMGQITSENVSRGEAYGITANNAKNCYYLQDTGLKCSGANSLTEAQMLIQSMYAGFDFDSVWILDSNAGYPYPQLRENIQDLSTRVDAMYIFAYPLKLDYMTGETLDLSGGMIEVVYCTGESEIVDITEGMISGYDANLVGEQTLTVTYKGQSDSFKINMEKSPQITTVELSKEPTKKEFVVGTAFDYSGAQLKVSYDNGTHELVDVTEEMVSGGNINRVGTQTLSITYGEYVMSFTVEVIVASISSIKITALPTKLIYVEDEELDLTGMAVAAVYTNGKEIALKSGYTVSGYSSAPGVHRVVLTYDGKMASFEVTVMEKERCKHNDTKIVNVVDATCTKDGYSGDEVCKSCDEVVVKGIVVTAKGHTEIVDKEIEPTCTRTGLTEGKHCSVCNTVIVKQTEVKANGHTEVIDQAVEVTCTENGLTEGKHCSVCDTVLVKQETVEAKGHTEVIDKEVEATCTENGLTEGKHCSACDTVLVKQETVEAKGHTEVIDKEVEATCTEEGLTEGKHCSVCNTVLEKQEVVKAAGHTFGEWTVVKEATQEEEGLEERVCTKCNEKEQQTIDKLPVTPTPEPTPDPTPTPEPTPTPFENPFKDVTEADWYYKSVMWGAENKVVAGVTADMFAPMASCTRAQIVTFLWRAAGKPEAAIDTCTFKDVDATAYYYKAMLWGTENKIISGYNTETFAPDATCTRAELVTFLWRIDGFTTVENVENTFTDVSENDWFYKAVLWAKEEGITSGYTPTTCAPNMQVTRAETVAMLYRYYN